MQNKLRSITGFLAISLNLMLGGSLAAQDKATSPSGEATKQWYDKVKVSGLLFGDAYFLSNHADTAIEGQSGFWIRRGYLTVDASLTKDWSYRMILEVNSPGDFKTQSTLQPYVKDASLTRKWEQGELQLGIIPTPTWGFTESFWGYRSVERTPTDLYRLGSAREFGIGGKWNLAKGKVKLHGTLGNGAGIGSETNKGKKVAVSAGFFPNPALAFELYGETEDRPLRADRTTYHAFLGYKTKTQRYGLQYVAQDRQQGTGPDLRIAVASVYGVWQLSERANLLARFDRALDPNPEGDRISYLVLSRNHEFDFFLAGFDWRLAPKLHLIPNLELVRYHDRPGFPTPEDLAIARLTVFFQF